MGPHSTSKTVVAASLALILASAATAAATLSPADHCVADKTSALSKYALCALKARRTFEMTTDDAGYASDLGRCASKQSRSFAKAETIAGAGVCPVENDVGDVTAFADTSFNILVDALGGAPLPADAAACYTSLTTCQSGLDTCTGDLAACGGSGSAMLKTGQTICANTSGTVIPCGGTGQDGESQVGLATDYTDNGDGTITDNRTKLMWEKLANDGSIHDKDTSYLWLDGLAKVQALNTGLFGGHGDWRMPNIRELETLMNFGRDLPTATDAFNTTCANGCTVLTCSCTNPSQYWSSTTFESDKPCAWAVDFAYGSRTGLPKATNLFRVRAVRTAG